MVHKKKYFSLFLLLLFGMLFASFSTCYALTPSSEFNSDDLTAFLNYCVDQNSYSRYNQLSTYQSYLNNTTKFNSLLTVFKNAINALNIPYLEQVSFTISNYNTINIFANNNTIGNDFYHCRIWNGYDGYADSNYFGYIDDSLNIVRNAYYCSIHLDSTPSYNKNNFNNGASVSSEFISNINNIIDTNNSTVTLRLAGNFRQKGSFYYVTDNQTYGFLWCDDSNVINFQEPVPDVPDVPSGDNNSSGTGNITNTSGDITGSIDLSGITQGIADLQNQLSGDTQRITDQLSGDTQKIVNTLTAVPDLSGETISSEQITENIDFGLINNNSTLNGYTNFWFTLTNGLRDALTGNVRSIDITFRGETYTISLDNFSIQLPQQLKFILGMLSTIYFVILIVKWWKIIIDKITGGDIDEVLAMNEEERNYRFVLGGVYMLEGLFNFIIDLFFWLIGLIGSILIYPIQVILVAIIPRFR